MKDTVSWNAADIAGFKARYGRWPYEFVPEPKEGVCEEVGEMPDGIDLTNTEQADYAGDGVYVINLGWAIELRANDPRNPTDTIVLEPLVLAALNRIAERWKRK